MLCTVAHGASVLQQAGAGLVGAACTADEFVAGVDNVTDLEISAGLLNGTLPILGVPSNSTILLPTDAAWSTFQETYGVVSHSPHV